MWNFFVGQRIPQGPGNVQLPHYIIKRQWPVFSSRYNKIFHSKRSYNKDSISLRVRNLQTALSFILNWGGERAFSSCPLCWAAGQRVCGGSQGRLRTARPMRPAHCGQLGSVPAAGQIQPTYRDVLEEAETKFNPN
jgi:hypothetical protein